MERTADYQIPGTEVVHRDFYKKLPKHQKNIPDHLQKSKRIRYNKDTGICEGGVVSGQCIAVVSGKGGTGKTSLTAGVGTALAQSGKRVLCMDCDIGLRNLDLALGLTDRALMDFSDVALDRCPLEAAVCGIPVFDLRADGACANAGSCRDGGGLSADAAKDPAAV